MFYGIQNMFCFFNQHVSYLITVCLIFTNKNDNNRMIVKIERFVFIVYIAICVWKFSCTYSYFGIVDLGPLVQN